jgi:hypothetical protein
MTLPEDLSQLLRAFHAHKVEYVVVGCYAVGIYSEPRATGDLDLFIRASVSNSVAVHRALGDYGAPLTGLTPADFCNDPISVIQIGHAPARIDIVQAIDGVDFDEAWRNRVELSLDGVVVHIISAVHLIQNKLKSGRLQDLAYVEAIREADKANRQGKD